MISDLARCSAIVRQAPQKERKCWLARTRRLMARWSCSKTLLRYCTGRCRQLSARAPLALSCSGGWRITGVLVGIDYARRGMVLSAQGFRSESA